VKWHYSLAQYLSDEIESIQRRALRIIFPDLKYEDAFVRAGVVSSGVTTMGSDRENPGATNLNGPNGGPQV
jgi:hypothetical protein